MSAILVLDVGTMQQLKTTDGQAARLLLAPGQPVALPEGAGTVRFDGVKRYASFDLRSDPPKGWALGSARAALAGLMASLFVRRRRIWIRVTAPAGGTGRTVVEVAGLARGEDAGLDAEVRAVLAGTIR